MANRKLLSICIPTWNRSTLLEELLRELVGQIEIYQLSDQVEILVSNNNSEDNTEEVILEFQHQFKFIKYNKNKTNIGAKGNLIKSVELSDGEFCIVLGDDDRIRTDCLRDILDHLTTYPDTGLLIDKSNSKYSSEFEEGTLPLNKLLQNFYWYMGNAGFFIMRTDFMKKLLLEYNYDYFNECWVQIQVMILGISRNTQYKCYLKNLFIHRASIHTEVMVYNSFYLWRTCNIELLNAIDTIKPLIDKVSYDSARFYLRKSIFQQVFNILQCAVFVDEDVSRGKTRSHIWKNLKRYSLYERVFWIFVVFVILIPRPVAKLFSNIFIYLIRGKDGINRKNDFVRQELNKMEKMKAAKSGQMRTLEFEVDN